MSQNSKCFSMVPIKRTDIFQAVIEQITRLIDHDLNTGDRLPSERELAESLGVSRTSIRQALKVLEASGRVETRVGSGTYVTSKSNLQSINQRLLDDEITKDFMKKLIVVRTGIEKMIFEDAFDKITPEQIGQLSDLVQENLRDSHVEDSGLDLSFEGLVGQFTNNEILIAIQNQIHQLWIQSWRKFGYTPESHETLHQEHLDIIQAIKSRDKQLMFKLLTAHTSKDLR